jgi:hypothetical protein
MKCVGEVVRDGGGDAAAVVSSMRINRTLTWLCMNPRLSEAPPPRARRGFW